MSEVSIVLIFLGSVFAALKLSKWKDKKWVTTGLVLIGFIAAASIALNEYRKLQKQRYLEKVYAKIGEIHDRDGAANKTFRIGKSASYYTVRSELLIDTADRPILALNMKENKLFIIAIIRDLKGEVVAVLDENIWKIFDDKNYEYNDNDNSFEVVSNGNRIVYFQGEIENGYASVSGLFVDGKGMGCYATSDDSLKGANFMLVNPKEPFVFPDVKPIFKYPREMFYGVRAN